MKSYETEWGVQFYSLDALNRVFRAGLVPGRGQELLRAPRLGRPQHGGSKPKTLELNRLYTGYTDIGAGPDSAFAASETGQTLPLHTNPKYFTVWRMYEMAAYGIEDSPSGLFVAHLRPLQARIPPPAFLEKTGLTRPIGIDLYAIVSCGEIDVQHVRTLFAPRWELPAPAQTP